jgi:hypothetical protein
MLAAMDTTTGTAMDHRELPRLATTDLVAKLIEYAAAPSLRAYVLLEQTAVAATLFQRGSGGEWTASAHMADALVLPGLDITLPLADLDRGLTFPA